MSPLGRLLNEVTGLVRREVARTKEAARVLKSEARAIAALEDARA